MEIDLPLQIIIQELENGLFIGEAILFPEISRFHDAALRVEPGVTGSVGKFCEKIPLSALSGRIVNSETVIHKTKIEVNPVRRSMIWRNPAPMIFHSAVWRHGSGMWLAYIPVLRAAVAGRTRSELEERIPEQIISILHRDRINLEKIVRFQHVRQFCLRERVVKVRIPNLKTRVQDWENPSGRESALSKTGIELTGRRLKPAYEVDGILAQLADILSGGASSSVLIIGPSGVGKTALIHETARRRNQLGLASVRFFEMSGAGIVAGQTGFGIWQERCRNLIEECRKKDVVLVLGNLLELTDVGKSEHNTQGVAAFLKPYLQRGAIRIIVECTPEQLPLIERADPHLTDQFRRIRMENATPETCRQVLRLMAERFEKQLETDVSAQALDEIIRLHQRFALYSTMPARPVRFLTNLMSDIRKKRLIAGDVTAYFTRETGLPLFMIDDAEPLHLEKTERWFNNRIIGQEGAVRSLCAQIALVKTALSRTGKPLCAQLFIGPTGVGKTELAKVLAEFLFSDPDRMVRFDMSEYASFQSVQRLAGDDSAREGLLSAKIREQPFCVLLLDELEKAHPLFFDLMLQILGEGRLTDAGGRVADFSNSVIIMTSNLGAYVFQKGKPGFGQTGAGRAGLELVAEEVRQFFRPELVNRIDGIVPFYPLESDSLVAIAERMLGEIRRRDGIRFRNVNLEFDPGAIRYLAEKAHDPKYGARPLRRRIEREILAPLSEKLNTAPPERMLCVRVSATGGFLLTDVAHSVVKKDRKPSPLDQAAVHGAKQIIDKIANLRRRAQKALNSQIVRTFQGDRFRYRKLAQQAHILRKKRRFLAPRFQNALVKLPSMESMAVKMDDTWNAIEVEEDEVMRRLYAGELDNQPELLARIDELDRKWQNVLMSFYALKIKKPNRILMAVYGESRSYLFSLCGAYVSVFEAAGYDLKTYRMTRTEATESGKIIELLKAPKDFFSGSGKSEAVTGILFDISGSYVFPTYMGENGIHRFQSSHRNVDCRVCCVADLPEDYRIPNPIFKDKKEREPRRTFRFEDDYLVDHELQKRIIIGRKPLAIVLAKVVDKATALALLSRMAANAHTNQKIDIQREVPEIVHHLFARFHPYAPFPGHASRFLKQLIDRAAQEKKSGLTARDAVSRFIKDAGLPDKLIDDTHPLNIEDIKASLKAEVIGQDQACRIGAKIIAAFKAGMNDPGKPVGALLFCGPTGVGKTQLAKTITNYCFGHGREKKRLIRLDMSEYTGIDATRRLTGDPATGESKMIREIRRQPFAVILFDEIEKAAPEVFDILLNILDEGRFTDIYGRITSFRSAIIVMTSNLGVESGAPIGFDQRSQGGYEKEIRAFFRPEFFNRIDEIVPFNHLGPDRIRKIAAKELADIAKREGILKRGITLAWTPALIDFLARIGYHPKYGARNLQRTIEEKAAIPLARYLLDHIHLSNVRLKMDIPGR